MPRFTYTQAMLEFLAATYVEYSLEKTTDLFNFAFGLKQTPMQIKATCKNHRIRCGRTTGTLNKGKSKLFTPEQVEFIKNQYSQYSATELTSRLNHSFASSFTVRQLRSFVKNHGIPSGRSGRFEPGATSWNEGMKGWSAGGNSLSSRFNKGHIPLNHRPVGSERTDNKDGFIMVKVAEPNKWQLKHRVVWEQANGKIPPNHLLWFKDNDRTNCSLDNLLLVSRAQNGVVNKLGLSKLPAESKATALLLADISMKKTARAA